MFGAKKYNFYGRTPYYQGAFLCTGVSDSKINPLFNPTKNGQDTNLCETAE